VVGSKEIRAVGHWDHPKPLITHMPSGLTELTKAIYQTTEHHPIASPLARQLLHLACHAENLPELAQARRDHGLVIDRWWWSTVAYGWFGGLDTQLSEDAFFSAVNRVWDGFDTDMVFLFLSAYADTRCRPAADGEKRRAGGNMGSSYGRADVEIPGLCGTRLARVQVLVGSQAGVRTE
jgi:thymidylate kinase